MPSAGGVPPMATEAGAATANGDGGGGSEGTKERSIVVGVDGASMKTATQREQGGSAAFPAASAASSSSSSSSSPPPTFEQHSSNGTVAERETDLQEEALDAAAVAHFLRSPGALPRAAVGDLLGHNSPQVAAVLAAYARSFDWRGLGFEQGLRTFLDAFRLPGEAQKIYRVLDAWSVAYFEANRGGAGKSRSEAAVASSSSMATATMTTSSSSPNNDSSSPPSSSLFPFASADALHVLAFSTIMLNTDAHSAQVKRKMTRAEFVSNNRGINGGADLPREALEALYDSILADPIKVPAVSAAAGAAAVVKGSGSEQRLAGSESGEGFGSSGDFCGSCNNINSNGASTSLGAAASTAAAAAAAASANSNGSVHNNNNNNNGSSSVGAALSRLGSAGRSRGNRSSNGGGGGGGGRATSASCDGGGASFAAAAASNGGEARRLLQKKNKSQPRRGLFSCFKG